jgi:hypothetical protein
MKIGILGSGDGRRALAAQVEGRQNSEPRRPYANGQSLVPGRSPRYIYLRQ